MSYIKKKIVDGDTVIDQKLLDHMQNGIMANDKVLNAAKGEHDSLVERLDMLEIKSTVTLECDITHMTSINEQPAIVNYTFRSTMSGSGTAAYFVNNVQRKTERIQQGDVSTDLSNYLIVGTNDIKIQVKDSVGTVNLIELTIECVEVKIESTFDSSKIYTGNISFVYKCFGIGLNKTAHIYMDGQPLTDNDVGINIGTTHNQNIEYIIRNISTHGSHLFEIYYETDDGYKSNTLQFDIMFSTAKPHPIISSILGKKSITYGDSLPVKYAVFTHGKETTDAVERKIYGFTYEICTPDTEGSLIIIENNAESVGTGEIKLRDLESLDNYKDFKVGDVILGTKTLFASSMLTDVVNQREETWVIQDYPSSGYIAIEITAKSESNDIDYTTTKEFSIYIDDSDVNYELEAVSTRLILALNASNRTNSDENKGIWNYNYTSKDDVTTIIEADLQDFNYTSNGWLMDSDSSPVLRHSGMAKTTIKVPIFSAGYTDKDGNVINFSGLPQTANSGRTIEIEFNVHDVTNDNTTIIKCYDETTDIGFVITPSYAYLLSSATSLSYDEHGNIDNKDAISFATIKDDERIKLSIVIEPIGFFVDKDNNMNKQMVRMYINGELCSARPYTDSTSFNQSSFIEIGSDKCITDIYSVRLYDDALSDQQILQNYVADKDNINTKITIFKDNDVLDAIGNVNYELCRKKYPCMLITGKLSGFKGDKTKVGIIYTKPDETENDGYVTELNLMDKVDDNYVCQSNVQGTSSQRYAKKNYKLSYKKNANGEVIKVKYKLKGNQSIGEDTLCYKIDYMSPNHSNTANANLLSSLFKEPVPPQLDDNRVQITIYGYRCLLFQRDDIDSPIKFHGDGCLNNDKGNTATFGLENDSDNGNDTKCQKWEFLDNSQDICNFRTDALMKDMNGEYAVLSSLESCYPDQGDLEDEGLLPNYDHIQILFTWICQRANFLHASKDSSNFTPVVYNGVTYNNEYDYRKAIFKNEFELHFNLNHVLTYYLAIEYVALIDNRAKNMFLSCYDLTVEDIKFFNYNYKNISDIIEPGTGNVDVNAIDWERSTFAIWYTSLYDMDSGLGVENSGYNLVPYYAEWDYKHKGQYLFNGADSEFWLMVEEVFGEEIKATYNKCRTEDRTLTYSNFYKHHVSDNADLVCPTIVNQDARFKYIDIWTEGYNVFQEDNITQVFQKTSDYMYLVRGGMKYHNTEFMRNRDTMLASKYRASDYLNDKLELRIGYDPDPPVDDVSRDMFIKVIPATTMYCSASWGNSDIVHYADGYTAKTMAGEECEIYPQPSKSYRDILLSIYGASNLSSVGDLSHFVAYSVDVSKAKKLQVLKLGDSSENYNNYRLETLDVTSNLLLKSLNVQKCTSLSGSLNLTQNSLLEEFYGDGSALSTIDFPVGGYLKKLYLPALNNLTVRDHKYIEEFTMDSYDNIQKLWIENDINNSIPTLDIFTKCSKKILRLRLIGINWNLGDDPNSVLNLLVDESMSKKQINLNGEEVDDYPVITGTINVNFVSPDTLSRLNTLYPNLIINYGILKYRANFRNSDGSVLYFENLEYGETPKDPVINNIISRPTLSPSMNPDDNHRITVKILNSNTQRIEDIEYIPEQYTFTFYGWDQPISTVPNITNYYAVYTITPKTYTVTFYSEKGSGTIIEQHTNLTYGSSLSTPFKVPVTSKSSSDSNKGYKFIKWVDENGNDADYSFIKSNLTLYGYFELVYKREIPTSHDYLEFTPIYDGNTVVSYSVKQNEANKPSGLLVIPKVYGDFNITSIPDNGFENNIGITELIFLDNNFINYIGTSAFSGCSSLTTTNISNTLITGISDFTFNDCVKLESIRMSSMVICIGDSAFKNVNSGNTINEVNIPNSVVTISANAFANVSINSLKYGDLQLGVINENISIDETAFSNSTISDMKIYQNRVIDVNEDNSIYDLTDTPWGALIKSKQNIQALPTVYVKFVNYDPVIPVESRECLFETVTIVGGSVKDPITNNDIPTPEYTDPKYIYGFTNWDKDLTSLGDITNTNDQVVWVVAVYNDKTVRKYGVKFYKGKELLNVQDVEYGELPKMNFDIPVYNDKYFGKLDYIDLNNGKVKYFTNKTGNGNTGLQVTGPRIDVIDTYKDNYTTEIKVKIYSTRKASIFGTCASSSHTSSGYMIDGIFIENGSIKVTFRYGGVSGGYSLKEVAVIKGPVSLNKNTPNSYSGDKALDIYNKEAIININDKGSVFINGDEVYTGTVTEPLYENEKSPTKIPLFTGNGIYGSSTYYSGYGYYFYYFKIWDGDKLIRDIVPIYSDGEVIFLNKAYDINDSRTGKPIYLFNYDMLYTDKVSDIYDVVKLPDGILDNKETPYVFSGWNGYNKDIEPITRDTEFHAFYEPLVQDLELKTIDYNFYFDDLEVGYIDPINGNVIETNEYMYTPDFLKFDKEKFSINIHEDYYINIYEYVLVNGEYIFNSCELNKNSGQLIINPSNYYKISVGRHDFSNTNYVNPPISPIFTINTAEYKLKTMEEYSWDEILSIMYNNGFVDDDGCWCVTRYNNILKEDVDIPLLAVGDTKTIKLTNGENIIVRIEAFNKYSNIHGDTIPLTLGLVGVTDQTYTREEALAALNKDGELYNLLPSRLKYILSLRNENGVEYISLYRSDDLVGENRFPFYSVDKSLIRLNSKGEPSDYLLYDNKYVDTTGKVINVTDGSTSKNISYNIGIDDTFNRYIIFDSSKRYSIQTELDINSQHITATSFTHIYNFVIVNLVGKSEIVDMRYGDNNEFGYHIHTAGSKLYFNETEISVDMDISSITMDDIITIVIRCKHPNDINANMITILKNNKEVSRFSNIMFTDESIDSNTLCKVGSVVMPVVSMTLLSTRLSDYMVNYYLGDTSIIKTNKMHLPYFTIHDVYAYEGTVEALNADETVDKSKIYIVTDKGTYSGRSILECVNGVWEFIGGSSNRPLPDEECLKIHDMDLLNPLERINYGLGGKFITDTENGWYSQSHWGALNDSNGLISSALIDWKTLINVIKYNNVVGEGDDAYFEFYAGVSDSPSIFKVGSFGTLKNTYYGTNGMIFAVKRFNTDKIDDGLGEYSSCAKVTFSTRIALSAAFYNDILEGDLTWAEGSKLHSFLNSTIYETFSIEPDLYNNIMPIKIDGVSTKVWIDIEQLKAGNIYVGFCLGVGKSFIPVKPIPLKDCSWGQIDAIGQLGYQLNPEDNGPFVIDRMNYETQEMEVQEWFNIGDTKTIYAEAGYIDEIEDLRGLTVANDAFIPTKYDVRIEDFFHDRDIDGNLIPFFFSSLPLFIIRKYGAAIGTSVNSGNYIYFKSGAGEQNVKTYSYSNTYPIRTASITTGSETTEIYQKSKQVNFILFLSHIEILDSEENVKVKWYFDDTDISTLDCEAYSIRDKLEIESKTYTTSNENIYMTIDASGMYKYPHRICVPNLYYYENDGGSFKSVKAPFRNYDNLYYNGRFDSSDGIGAFFSGCKINIASSVGDIIRIHSYAHPNPTPGSLYEFRINESVMYPVDDELKKHIKLSVHPISVSTEKVLQGDKTLEESILEILNSQIVYKNYRSYMRELAYDEIKNLPLPAYTLKDHLNFTTSGLTSNWLNSSALSYFDTNLGIVMATGTSIDGGSLLHSNNPITSIYFSV